MTGLLMCFMFLLMSSETVGDINKHFPGPWSQLLGKGINTMSLVHSKIQTKKIGSTTTRNPSHKGQAESINDDQFVDECGSDCFHRFPTRDEQFDPFVKDDQVNSVITTTISPTPIPIIDHPMPIRPNINFFPRPPPLMLLRYMLNDRMRRTPIMARPFLNRLPMMPPPTPQFFHPFFYHQPPIMARNSKI